MGDAVPDDAEKPADPAEFSGHAGSRERFAAIERSNKVILARHIDDAMRIDPDSLSDGQIGRNPDYDGRPLVETAALYEGIRRRSERNWTPLAKPFTGTEVSGAGNMTLAVNGAPGIVTFDGANARIRNHDARTGSAIGNVARGGWSPSDRTIRGHARDIGTMM